MHGPFRPCSSGDLPENFFQPELRSLERANDLLGISVEAGLCWESHPARRGILAQHFFSHSSHSRILFNIYYYIYRLMISYMSDLIRFVDYISPY